MSDDQNITRRDVLMRGGMAAAFAFGIPASVARAAQAAQDPRGAAADAAARAREATPVRVAWIGVGVQGLGQDVTSLLKMPGVKVVAVADIYEPNIKKAQEKIPGVEVFRDYRKLLERKDIDAVGIATPLYLHAPMAIDALNAGKHVYCEKMMAYTVEDAKKMVRTAEKTGKFLQVGHQRRYSVDYHHANEMVKKGYLGKVTHLRAQWNRNGSWRRAVPDANDKNLERLINWRLYKAYSRGLMAELGSHQIDIANWFLNEHPISVVGIGGIDTYKDGREVYDNVQVIFEYPSGAKLTYQSIQSNAHDADGEQIMGPKGTLVLTEQSGNKNMIFQEKSAELEFAKFSQNKAKVGNKEAIVLDAGATTAQDKRGRAEGATLAQGADTAKKTNWHLALEDWVDCIRANRKPYCDGRIGLADTVCVIAANKAMETGTKVQITEEMFSLDAKPQPNRRVRVAQPARRARR